MPTRDQVDPNEIRKRFDEAGLWDIEIMRHLTVDPIYVVLAKGRADEWQRLLKPTIPREIAMAVAALKAGIGVVQTRPEGVWQALAGVSGELAIGDRFDAPAAALAAAAEALGLEPWTGETP